MNLGQKKLITKLSNRVLDLFSIMEKECEKAVNAGELTAEEAIVASDFIFDGIIHAQQESRKDARLKHLLK